MTKIKSNGTNGTGTKIIKSSLPKSIKKVTVKNPGQKAKQKGDAEKIKKDIQKNPPKEDISKSRALNILDEVIEEVISTSIYVNFESVYVSVSQNDWNKLFRFDYDFFEFHNPISGELFQVAIFPEDAIKDGKYMIDYIKEGQHKKTWNDVIEEIMLSEESQKNFIKA
jgi:hypothetical protein